jgi:filamentous hemagglutinin
VDRRRLERRSVCRKSTAASGETAGVTVAGSNDIQPLDSPNVSISSPNATMRVNANISGTYVNPLDNQIVSTDETLAADHIVPQSWIRNLEGFDSLTPDQQSWLLNHPLNTQGLPQTFNSSKGALLPENWTSYKGQPLDPTYIQNNQLRGSSSRSKTSIT